MYRLDDGALPAEDCGHGDGLMNAKLLVAVASLLTVALLMSTVVCAQPDQTPPSAAEVPAAKGLVPTPVAETPGPASKAEAPASSLAAEAPRLSAVQRWPRSSPMCRYRKFFSAATIPSAHRLMAFRALRNAGSTLVISKPSIQGMPNACCRFARLQPQCYPPSFFLPGGRMVLASYQLRGGISPNSHLLWGPTLGGRKKQERLQSAQSCRGPCQDNRMAREGGASRLTG